MLVMNLQVMHSGLGLQSGLSEAGRCSTACSLLQQQGH